MTVSVRVGVVLLPVLLLVLATVWSAFSGRPQLLLWLGTAFQILLSSLIFRERKRWLQPLGTSIFTLYLIALVWLWLGIGTTDLDHGYLRFAQALLLLVSMAIFAMQVMADTDARKIHQAYLLAQRLSNRKDWPADLASCQTLPEVKALREALHMDATPAFALLRDTRPQVQIAALAALEFRRDWRPGQAELVLEVAQNSLEPTIRAAAVSALANVDDQYLIEWLTDFLCDTSPEVRRAATGALLWDTERRWAWIRSAVRHTLSESEFQEDGPLLHSGQLLSVEAMHDLNAWVTEKGILAVRSAQTLVVHYGRALNENPDATLTQNLRRQIEDAHTPPVLRIELAQLLKNNQLLDRALQEKLLDPFNPAPLRLVAAEALLAAEVHAGAVATLRDIARMPNRDIALATADVVQRRLGIDLGLAVGQPLPQGNSRQAAEVTRRVMTWANQCDPADAEANQEPLHN